MFNVRAELITASGSKEAMCPFVSGLRMNQISLTYSENIACSVGWMVGLRVTIHGNSDL